jgi:hypothetical protein
LPLFFLDSITIEKGSGNMKNVATNSTALSLLFEKSTPEQIFGVRGTLRKRVSS